MNEAILEKVDNIIFSIKETREYQNMLQIRQKMEKNEKLMSLIEEVKTLQKRYVATHCQDDEIKLLLDQKEEQLMSIPLYVDYLSNLEVVNDKLEFVKEKLNQYFSDVINLLK